MFFLTEGYPLVENQQLVITVNFRADVGVLGKREIGDIILSACIDFF